MMMMMMYTHIHTHTHIPKYKHRLKGRLHNYHTATVQVYSHNTHSSTAIKASFKQWFGSYMLSAESSDLGILRPGAHQVQNCQALAIDLHHIRAAFEV